MKNYKSTKYYLKKIQLISHINYPPKVLLPIRQGTKKDSQPIVSVGTKVVRGQLIAKGKEKGTQNHHSSIGGVVTRLKNFHYPSEYADVKSIEIKLGGYFSTFTKKQRSLEDQITNKEILRIIKEAGIYDYDMGSVDLYLANKQNIDVSHVIINAVEFSPLLYLEEKILQMHSEEICIALQYIFQLFSNSNTSPNFIVNSNYRPNRMKITKTLRKSYGFMSSSSNMNKFQEQTGPFDVREVSKILLGCKALRKSTKNQISENKEYKICILRPSTLLAVYEAIILKKQYLDVYIQIINGEDDIYLQRVPLGIPIIYLFPHFNKLWQGYPRHCFIGDFRNRKTLLNLLTPVIKSNLHYWFLTDENFAVVYKQLNTWLAE